MSNLSLLDPKSAAFLSRGGPMPFRDLNNSYNLRFRLRLEDQRQLHHPSIHKEDLYQEARQPDIASLVLGDPTSKPDLTTTTPSAH
jgi:hypothetical protein